jgi:hypothetical protein
MGHSKFSDDTTIYKDFKKLYDDPKNIQDYHFRQIKVIADPVFPGYNMGDPAPYINTLPGYYPFVLAQGHQFGPELTEQEKVNQSIEAYNSIIDQAKNQVTYLNKQLDDFTRQRDELKKKAEKK